MDSSCKKSESKSAPDGIPRDFLWRLRRNFKLYKSLSLSHVIPRYLLVPFSPDFSQDLMKNPPLLRILSTSCCRAESSLTELAPTPPSSMYVSSRIAWRMAGWRWGGGICDECFDSCNFGTSCIIAGRTVAERDCLIPEISPGRVRGRSAGKEVGKERT